MQRTKVPQCMENRGKGQVSGPDRDFRRQVSVSWQWRTVAFPCFDDNPPMSQSPPPLVPLATLAYQPPPQSQRPGLMTAVGVVSIVLASLSAISSVGGVFSNLAMLMMSTMSAKMASIQATVPIAAPTPIVTVDGVLVDPQSSPDAMNATQRNIVIDAISAARNLTTLRRQHLNLLLENSGHKMFPFVTDDSTIDQVRQKVLVSSTSSPMLDVFDIGTGSLRILDRNATFYANGTPSTNGVGEVVQANVVAMPTTQSSAAATPTPMPPFVFRVNPVASIMGICENLVSLLVAILLLVAGILLLRDSPKFWRPHWWFVWLKFPLVVVASVAYYLTYSTMMNGFAAAGRGGSAPPVPMGNVMLVPTMMWGVMGMAYPIALIFVLRSRTAKMFYDGLRGIRPWR